jgi:Family of unknown function (DUF5681)
MSSGYGKPPKNGQFKKGQSGNPKGRPKKSSEPVSRAYLFRKVANEMVAIKAGTRNEIMTRWEALVRQVQNLALSKDSSAARLLHQMRKKFPGSAVPGDKYIWVVSDADMKL